MKKSLGRSFEEFFLSQLIQESTFWCTLYFCLSGRNASLTAVVPPCFNNNGVNYLSSTQVHNYLVCMKWRQLPRYPEELGINKRKILWGKIRKKIKIQEKKVRNPENDHAIDQEKKQVLRSYFFLLEITNSEMDIKKIGITVIFNYHV